MNAKSLTTEEHRSAPIKLDERISGDFVHNGHEMAQQNSPGL
jgi:hypothetical protein